MHRNRRYNYINDFKATSNDNMLPHIFQALIKLSRQTESWQQLKVPLKYCKHRYINVCE